jgi:hypothetical protein
MPPLSNPRRRAWGKLLSALAGGGLTAAGLGPLSGGALGAEMTLGTSPSSEGSSTPVTAPGSGAEADTGQPSTTTTTIPMPSRTSPPKPATRAPARTPAPNASKAPAVVLQVKQKTTAGKTAPGNVTATHAQPTTGAPSKAGAPSAGNNVAPAPQVVAAQAGALAAELAASAASAQALAYYRIPLFLLPIYQAASVQYGVPWQILAAINEIETNYGSDLSVSTAGAVGWMQFMPATWIQYGVDALNAGYADPYNPVDAIFAAARYLRAAGASSDLSAAILAYNHSAEYVSSVLLRAKLISTYPKSVISTLTGLTDGRPPVTGRRLAWGSLTPAASSSSATAQATAVASGSSATPPAAAANSSAPPSPAAAAAAAAGKAGSSARALQLVDLISAPNAAVVAVQDGRVVELGNSRKLGRYVILRDTYGDLFTYAGLGSIAPSYRLPKAPRTASASGEGLTSAAARTHEPAPTQPASAGRQAPLTLKVKTPPRRTAAGIAAAPRGTAGAAGGHAPLRPGSTESVPAGAGKVRLFAHPGNPDALASSASAANSARRDNPRSVGAGHPLRRGSVVAKGTVLGHVRVPHGARAGHLRFAIRPAGDQSSVDPRPILENWVALDAALHPQGAKGETDLLGATASGAFLLSKSELERAVLSDPGISIYACGRQDIASGAIDKRVLAVLAFLSRSGLKPTVSALRCGHSEHTVSGYTSEHFSGDAVDISAINGIPIAGHEGTGTITDITIRALLTLQGEFVPHQIISLMQYPGAANTLAMPEHWNHIHVGFRPAGATVLPNSVAAATAAHSAGPGQTAPSPLVVSGDLSTTQWDQLFTRIATLPTPTVSGKPSSAAIRDPKRP